MVDGQFGAGRSSGRTVVVTVGTDHHRFDRLMSWVEQWLLTAPADVKGPQVIKAAVSWLVCKNICIPEDTVLTITVPVGDAKPDAAVAKYGELVQRGFVPLSRQWKTAFQFGHVFWSAKEMDPGRARI